MTSTLFDLPSFQRRLVLAMGLMPALTACGGLVVLVEDGEGEGGWPPALGGAPSVVTDSVATGTGAGNEGGAGEGGFCPNHEGLTYVCFQTFEGCPELSSPETAASIEAEVETDQSCTNDPEFCWCSATVLDVTCGPDPEAFECCYYAALRVDEACEGRPFIVAAVARVAPLVDRSDWASPLAPSIGMLSARERAAISEVWAKRAQFEHASIASFARFVLDLLAVGAPVELVLAATHAMGDEVEHAQICFGLASSIAERHIGPGALAIDGAMEGRRTLAEIARAAVIEGCIGETQAAIVATMARDVAECPVVRAAMSKIARDELEHAELAWRFVAWAFANGDSTVRTAIEAAFGEPCNGCAPEVVGVAPAVARRFGIVSVADHRTLSERAWREVIVPSRDALVFDVAPLAAGAFATC